MTKKLNNGDALQGAAALALRYFTGEMPTNAREMVRDVVREAVKLHAEKNEPEPLNDFGGISSSGECIETEGREL